MEARFVWSRWIVLAAEMVKCVIITSYSKNSQYEQLNLMKRGGQKFTPAAIKQKGQSPA